MVLVIRFMSVLHNNKMFSNLLYYGNDYKIYLFRYQNIMKNKWARNIIFVHNKTMYLHSNRQLITRWLAIDNILKANYFIFVH